MILSQISVLKGLLKQIKILQVHPLLTMENPMQREINLSHWVVAFPMRPTASSSSSSSFAKVMQRRQTMLVTSVVVTSRGLMMSLNCC